MAYIEDENSYLREALCKAIAKCEEVEHERDALLEKAKHLEWKLGKATDKIADLEATIDEMPQGAEERDYD